MAIKFFDSTLRDGSHAINQQLTAQNVADYCQIIDNANEDVVIVGHGNGLGASSLNVGLAKTPDKELLCAAREKLKKTPLGVFLLPGFGTIEDDLLPAFELGVDLACVASHCTEADITKQHIEFTRAHNKLAYGVLMMQHTISDEEILEQAQKMESYGANGIILMDSAGASLPDMVSKGVDYLKNHLNIEVGFHAHNNLGMAVANSIAAIQAGADIVDGTVRAFGAGAGNAQLEVVGIVLEKMGIPIRVDPYILMDAGEAVIKKLSHRDVGIDNVNLISGSAGVFSSYAPHVIQAAETFGVDYRDIFLELGRRKVVGGQEDMIVQVAAWLKNGVKGAEQ